MVIKAFDIKKCSQYFNIIPIRIQYRKIKYKCDNIPSLKVIKDVIAVDMYVSLLSSSQLKYLTGFTTNFLPQYNCIMHHNIVEVKHFFPLVFSTQ